MGVAAWNRGSALVERQITESLGDHHMKTIIDDLNALPKSPNAARLFCNTVIRLAANGRQWWIMDNQNDGWAAYGFVYSKLRDLVRDNKIAITGCGHDGVSFYFNAIAL